MYYTYVIKRGFEEGYYIGYTQDLKRRFEEHSAGQKCKLVYYESYLTKELAQRREMNLKQFGGAWRALRKRIFSKK